MIDAARVCYYPWFVINNQPEGFLFGGNIHDWPSWSGIFQSVEIWEPLIRRIFEKEKLPCLSITSLTPGTNAVFRAGGHVIKIFVPAESGYDGREDLTEAAALQRAVFCGVACPKLAASGVIHDKYSFAYMITEYIEGKSFDEAAVRFNEADKVLFAGRLRKITDSINKPCEPVNDIDVIGGGDRHWRWDRYPESFRRERLEYISSHDYGAKVFVHGDLCGDNILIDGALDIHIIDFADAVMAPLAYEQAHVAIELFALEKAYLRGYFGEYERNELTDLCFNGIIIHDFGGDIVEQRLAKPAEITCLQDLRDRIRGKI